MVLDLIPEDVALQYLILLHSKSQIKYVSSAERSYCFCVLLTELLTPAT